MNYPLYLSLAILHYFDSIFFTTHEKILYSQLSSLNLHSILLISHSVSLFIDSFFIVLDLL